MEIHGFKLIIEDTKLEPYAASVSIIDKNNNYIIGYCVVEIVDKRKKL